MHLCCMTWYCHAFFWAFSLKGEADEVMGEEMHQESQMGGLCFGTSSLFLKELGGEKQLALGGENDRGKGSQKQHLSTRSLLL